MPLACQASDGPQKSLLGRHRQKPQTDQRELLQAVRPKVRGVSQPRLVESRNLLMQLDDDSAYQLVTEARHLPQGDARAVLHVLIRLRKRVEHRVAFLHGRLTSSGQ